MMNIFYKALFPVAFACCTLAFVACSDDGSDFLQAPYGKAGPVVPDSSDDASSSSARGASSSSLASSSSVGSSSSLIESYVKGSSFNAFTDKRDGNVYRVAVIGSQVWMAEDLRYYSEDLQFGLLSVCMTTGKKGACDGDKRLYSFYSAMEDDRCQVHERCEGIEYPHRGICPEGWHLPEIHEWKTLSSYVDGNANTLRAIGGWHTYNFGTDDYGFSAYPTGEWFYQGTKHDEVARYWSATETGGTDPESAYEFYIEGVGLKVQSYRKEYGYAVRCVADAGEVKLDKFVEVPTPSSSSVFSSSSEESSNSSVESSSSAESSSSGVFSSSLSSSSEVSSSSVSSSSAWDPYSHGEDWNSLEQITDERDGNKYRVVQVNEFIIWMAENLRYADSTATPALVGNTACIGERGERCEEGNLYTYAAAVNDLECATKVCFESEKQVRGICPEGWRLPKKADWNWLGYALNDGSVSFDAAGMLPTGERNGNGIVKYDGYARFWLVEEDAGSSAFEGYYYAGDYLLQKQSYMKSFGYAVRCVKDVE